MILYNKIAITTNIAVQILFSFYYTLFGLIIGHLFNITNNNNIYIGIILIFLLFTFIIFCSVIVGLLLFIFLLDELIADL